MMPTTLSVGDRSPVEIAQEQRQIREDKAKKELVAQVRSYLEKKKSPLAEVTPYLLKKKHWRLILGISAIESQWCNRKVYLNCWGIMNASGDLRHFSSLEEGIDYTDSLIERRQRQGMWLTIEDFNCSYVVPCNQTWVDVVTKTVQELSAYAH